MKPKVKYLAIYRHKDKYAISVMCKFFGVLRSGYYAYIKCMNNPELDCPLANAIAECQERCRNTYGYRRVHLWLDRRDIHRNPKTILRVMQKYNLLSKIRRRKKYKQMGQQLHKSSNLLDRNFTAEKPNQLIHDYIWFYNNERIQLKSKLIPLQKRCQFFS